MGPLIKPSSILGKTVLKIGPDMFKVVKSLIISGGSIIFEREKIMNG